MEFKGVSHTATVFLDEREIASHYNAYTSFSVIVKDLDAGEHTLEIRADNRFSKMSALHIPNDYMSYGGVSRPVVLEQISDIYIQWIHVTPVFDNSVWKAKIELKLENISTNNESVDARVRIAEKEILWESAEIEARNSLVLEGELEFSGIIPWTMEQPELYYASAYVEKGGVVKDDFIDRFGFREIRIEGKTYY